MALRDIAARSLDVLFPPACAVCGLPGDAVCAACRASLRPLEGGGCARCGHPWEIATGRCRECPAGVDVTRQAVAYDGVAQALVTALKDHRRPHMAVQIADLMDRQLPRPGAGITLVPVPLSPRRMRERGFNQADLIARQLGRRWGLPVVELLGRQGDASPQRGSSAKERHLQVRGVFHVIDAIPTPRAACLVDDVITTGATVSACARALRSGGVEAVGAVAFARVVGTPHALP